MSNREIAHGICYDLGYADAAGASLEDRIVAALDAKDEERAKQLTTTTRNFELLLEVERAKQVKIAEDCRVAHAETRRQLERMRGLLCDVMKADNIALARIGAGLTAEIEAALEDR